MRLVYKTLIPILFVLGATSIIAGVFLRISLENTLLKEQYFRINERVLEYGHQELRLTTFATTTDFTETLRLRAFVSGVKDTTVARVTVWDNSKKILYSDLNSIIGIRSPDQINVERALTGVSFYERKQSDDGYPRQSSIGDFIDIYIPIEIDGQVVGVAEVHSVAGAVLVPLAQELDFVVFVLLSSALLVLIIVVVVFRTFILRPIEQASAMAQAISNGDFTSEDVPVYKDEIGRLVQSLGVMRDRLRSLVGNLEHEVDIRTKKILEEEARLTASLGALSAGFVVVDTERRVLYSNPALERVLSLTKKPHSIQEIAESFGASYDINELYLKCIQSRETTDLKEVSLGVKTVRAFFAPVVMMRKSDISEGTAAYTEETLGAVILFDDVTDAKALERSREEFFTIASHELRTPLTAIRANASLLKQHFAKAKKKSEFSEVADDVHAASVRLIKIVHDFIDVATLEQGAYKPTLEKVDLPELAHSVVKELTPLAEKKHVTLQLENTPSPIFVSADKERLREVVVNLVGNALHYIEKGSVTISFAEHKGNLQMRVTDTGIGIPLEYQSLLFRKFQQAGKSLLSRDSTEGTGLGLYISKLIIESMHGAILLEKSAPGEGSVFLIELPLVQ
jgi:two-component system, OmpR family, phosphate regulon sensor histidine kinase PhoR